LKNRIRGSCPAPRYHKMYPVDPFIWVEVCPLTKAELHSLDFAVTRFLMKLFNTSSIAVMKDCCKCFYFKLQRELIEKRFKNSCQNVVSDRVRGYFMTHCAFIALL